MGQSARDVSPKRDANPAIARTTFAPVAGLEFAVRGERETVYHQKLIRDSDGNEISRQSVPVAYAIGSGRRGHSFLIPRDHSLFVSPIAWYAQKKRWDLSPQYRAFQNDGFERPATHFCLRCHVGRANPAAIGRGTFREPTFHELSIGCENCHGPGERHVAYRRKAHPAGPDPIVNPAKLAPHRRDSVCAHCHLSSNEVVLRYGRGPYDFRPGMRLSDVFAVFVSSDRVSAANAVSHVQQFRSSRCFQKSEGTMGCTSCHDPHSVPENSARDAFYRNRCLKCHGRQKPDCALPLARRTPAPFENSCIRCHMPRFDASDVPHTAQTDHRVLRRQIQAGVPIRRPAVADIRIFGDDNPGFSEVEKTRARNVLRARLAQRTGNPREAKAAREALVPILKRAREDVDLLDALARCEIVLRNPDEAIAYWDRLLKVSPGNQSALYELSGFLVDLRRYAAALPRLEELLRINPWFSDVHWSRSIALAGTGQLREALRSAEKAVELEPFNPTYHRWLAEIYARTGQPAKAARFRTTASRLEAVRRKSR